MMNRRDLLAAMGAATLAPKISWADARNPSFLSGARGPDGGDHLCGLSADGSVLFHLPIPARGHAAAAHPTRPEAVAFARRPGRFAIILDCARGVEIARLTPPPNRHFYGHGVFSQDGARLYTTENDLDTLEGRIGIWDARAGYARMGELTSGGIGPHDMARLPGSDTLVVANGGIATHPDSGRTPLNLATMRSNLSYLTEDGGVQMQVELDPALRMNSIRHLDIRPDGTVVAGLQWNGAEGAHPPLIMQHRAGGDPVLLEAPDGLHRSMQGYVGSIAFLANGHLIGATSPRGGMVQFLDAETGECLSSLSHRDACGLATDGTGTTLLTSGSGRILALDGAEPAGSRQSDWQWDNHLVAV